MDVDQIFATFNSRGVRFLLIGGMNFMLRHAPILTYDLDVWIEDVEVNRGACEAALADLDAEWGPSEDTWGSVAKLSSGWLAQQGMVCVSTPHGAVDVFRSVTGLEDWQSCWNRGVDERTSAGTSYRGLSDEDMLLCQTSLEPGLQKSDRIQALRDAIKKKGTAP